MSRHGRRRARAASPRHASRSYALAARFLITRPGLEVLSDSTRRKALCRWRRCSEGLIHLSERLFLCHLFQASAVSCSPSPRKKAGLVHDNEMTMSPHPQPPTCWAAISVLANFLLPLLASGGFWASRPWNGTRRRQSWLLFPRVPPTCFFCEFPNCGIR